MTPRVLGHLPHSRRAAFTRGLRSPSIGLVGVALVLAVAAIATAVAIVSHGGYVRVSETRLLRLAGDDATHISYQVALLKQRPPDGVPVYVLGGSAMREATISDAALAAALERRGGVPAAAYTLAGNEQSFAHDRAIIENLPAAGRRGGVVVIGVGFERFMRSGAIDPAEDPSDEEGLLLPGGASDSLEEPTADGLDDSLALARELSRYASSYALEHAGELLRLKLPYTSFVEHRYTPGDAWSSSKKRAALRRWYRSAGRPGAAFDKAFPASAVELESAVAAARERGFTVVLVEQPFDLQIAAGKLDRVRARARGLCTALAQRQGATYVDFLAATGLADDDFHDVSHLLPSGRPKFQSRLVAELAPVVRVASAPASRRERAAYLSGE